MYKRILTLLISCITLAALLTPVCLAAETAVSSAPPASSVQDTPPEQPSAQEPAEPARTESAEPSEVSAVNEPSASDSAQDDSVQPTQQQHIYQPRLMVTGYTVENDFLQPDTSGKITVTFKNMSRDTDISNIKLSFREPSGQLIFDGIASLYVDTIQAQDSYKWSFDAKAAKTAQSGEVTASVSAEYEDESGGSYSVSEDIRITVRQTVSLRYDGAQLPLKAVQGETVSISVNLMNTGKSVLRNVMLSFDVAGLTTGGSVLAGTIESGETKNSNANFNVSKDITGDVEGKLTITYEDDYGQTYEQTAPLSTLIVEKVETAQKNPEEEKKPSYTWLFLLIGAIAGGGAGFGVCTLINNLKQRKIDEETL